MNKHVFFSRRLRTLLFRSLFAAAALFLPACDLLRESPFEVIAWNPGNGFFPGFSETSIYFVFSHEADHISVERAFTLTEDGRAVTGYFSWDGKRCIFSPASPFRQNREYRVTILQDAMDTKGLSMDGHFEGCFYTREDGNRPELVSVDPPYDGVMNGERGTLTLEFSEPVDSLSLVQELSLSPSMTGFWSLDAEGREAKFTPLEPWRHNTLYQLRLSGNFLSVLGISMGSEFSSRFRTGLDTEPPRLEKASALDMEETELFELERDPSENSLWEGSYRLGLVFSESIDSASLKSRIAVHGGPALIMESPPGYGNSFVFRLDGKPEYGSRFSVSIAAGLADMAGNVSAEEYLFRIHANGPLSKPPSLVGLRLPLKPGDSPGGLSGPGDEQLGPGDAEPKAYSVNDLFADLPLKGDAAHYTFDTGIPSWIELYFDTAPGGEINLFSLMDLFRIESTNSALSFSPRSVVQDAFTWAHPHDPWSAYTRVEIRGLMVNHPAQGVIRFIVGSGLEDSLENRTAEAFELPLVK
ncbi:MAG: Ig-like domain-containing protein [Spirochaetaceae bacterium]|jgi:hypothetical protein|nr:Ig-like domain-containing protein [Spirochaetaceae bacterium]